MLSLRSSTACRAPCAAGRPSRRVAVPVRAGLGEAMNSIGQAFVKIFSPPKDDAPTENWSGTTNNFTGRISHHGAGKPFKDGFTAGKAAATEAAGAASETAEKASNETMDYVGGALESVMGKNFSGKEEENLPTTGAEGWKGDIHTRKRDGFHAPRN